MRKSSRFFWYCAPCRLEWFGMFFVTYHKYPFAVWDNGYSLYLGRDINTLF